MGLLCNGCFHFWKRKRALAFKAFQRKQKSRYFTIKDGENLFENNLGQKVLRGLLTLLFVEP